MIDKTELIYANMTPRQRQAFKLYQLGDKQGEIAEKLDISQPAVSKLLKSAILRTQKRLKRL